MIEFNAFSIWSVVASYFTIQKVRQLRTCKALRQHGVRNTDTTWDASPTQPQSLVKQNTTGKYSIINSNYYRYIISPSNKSSTHDLWANKAARPSTLSLDSAKLVQGTRGDKWGHFTAHLLHEVNSSPNRANHLNFRASRRWSIVKDCSI